MTTDARPSPHAAPLVDRVLAALSGLRIHVAKTEAEIQSAIAAALFEAAIPFQKEAVIGKGCRIDFLVAGGIGIEVKKGQPNSVSLAKQASRYAESPAISCVVLVVEKHAASRPHRLHDKPVHYVALHKLWGISL